LDGLISCLGNPELVNFAPPLSATSFGFRALMAVAAANGSCRRGIEGLD
jgi:hypothetical protein